MLSSMYVQVTVAIDNEQLKRRLDWLKERTVSQDASRSGTGGLVKYMTEVYEKCQSRRFVKTVLPLMTDTGKIAGNALEEFRGCQKRIREAYFVLSCFPREYGIDDRSIKQRIGTYAGLIEELIDEKEVSLFEYAKTVLSDENWFEIAETIMEEDAALPGSDGNGFRFREEREWTCFGTLRGHIAETEYRV